jgi:protein gp37
VCSIIYINPTLFGEIAMNKQQKNTTSRGIEWTDWTWNPTAGCMHGCTWQMPDGSIAECYAKKIAEGLARAAYPDGFESHYWREHVLHDPLKETTPSKIFVGSMADLFGHWVPEEQIHQILDVMRQSHWHVFQTLSKYPIRLPEFNPFPENVWVGVSLPAGQLMPQKGASRALKAYLKQMTRIEASVRFMSIEPLWFDAGQVFTNWLAENGSLPFEWVIIGAATNGPKTYQPDPEWVKNLLAVLDSQKIPVFFKGNLEWNPWREEFPVRKQVEISVPIQS